MRNNPVIFVKNIHRRFCAYRCEREAIMNDKKLRALLTAVQCGSFGKATAQLGYTQSAMTHMVNRLEAELGCTLLVRGSHGVRRIFSSSSSDASS